MFETVKINEIVRLLKFSAKSPNAYARVIAIEPNGVYVSNLNMPFQGTISYGFINNGQFKKETK